jgi:hypothetical protein
MGHQSRPYPRKRPSGTRAFGQVLDKGTGTPNSAPLSRRCSEPKAPGSSRHRFDPRGPTVTPNAGLRPSGASAWTL